jgi:hypothetical protein
MRSIRKIIVTVSIAAAAVGAIAEAVTTAAASSAPVACGQTFYHDCAPGVYHRSTPVLADGPSTFYHSTPVVLADSNSPDVHYYT